MHRCARTLLRFDGIEFDPVELRLLRNGAVLELQPKVSRLLELLASRAGQLVAKETLLDELWPETVVNEEALTQLVRKLRRALGDDAHRPRYVQTVTTRGYRFLPQVVTVMAAPVSDSMPVSTELASPANAVADEAPVPGGAGRRAVRAPLVAAAGGLAVAVVALLGWELVRMAHRPALQLGRTTVRRLTHTATHKQDPALSPDGRLVVYAANDPEEGQLDLYLLAVSGGAATRLTHTPGDEYAPEFSPDGERVLCSRLESALPPSIVVLPGLGGVERTLVSGGMWGCWSPDGREVAYAREAGGGWEIRRRAMETGAERTVARLDRAVVSLAWSPDGRRLAWTDETQLLVVPAAGGPVRRVGEPASYVRSLRWEAPTGALLTDATWRGRDDLWRVDPDSGRREALTAAGGNLFHPAASRDGRRLVYVQEAKEQVVLAYDREGRQPRAVAAKTTLRCLDVDPLGRWLAFTDDDPSGGAGHVGIMPLSGGAIRTLSEERSSNPAFSPDGLAVAFVHRCPDGDRLALAASAGGGMRRASAARGSALGPPAFSPDGRRLAVAGAFDGGPRGLYVCELDGGAVRRVAAGDFGAPAWLPDGRGIAVCGEVDGRVGLFRLTVDSGEARLLFGGGSRQARPIVAADGRTLLVLVGSRSRPRLVEVAVERGGATGREVEFERPAEAGFWGIFEVLRRPDGGFLALSERYEADLNLLEPAP